MPVPKIRQVYQRVIHKSSAILPHEGWHFLFPCHYRHLAFDAAEVVADGGEFAGIVADILKDIELVVGDAD